MVDVYSGEWKHNKRDGYGVLRSADGKNTKEGTWKDNKFVVREVVVKKSNGFNRERKNQGSAFFRKNTVFLYEINICIAAKCAKD